MPKRKAPKNTYWRGKILYGRLYVAGREHKFCLRTDDPATAKARVEAERKRLIALYHFNERTHPYEEVVVEWEKEMAHHVSAGTLDRYLASLSMIDRRLRPLDIDEIDREVVSQIVHDRREAGTTTATIRRDLTALSSVLNYAEQHGWRDGNPALSRLKQLRERRDPIILPDLADVALVVARAPGMFKTLIRAALLTGCRQDELVTAQRRRFDRRRRQLTVIGKRNKLRVIPLSDEAFDLFDKAPAYPGCPWVFWHGPGEPYRNVSSRFQTIRDSAQTTAQNQRRTFRPFRFHDLRHRFAVDYLKEGGSIYRLKTILGHTSVKTTEIYLAYLTPEESERAMYQPEQRPEQVQGF